MDKLLNEFTGTVRRAVDDYHTVVGMQLKSICEELCEKYELTIKEITIYEDENVLVINKPAGLLSMAKGEFTEETTLEDYGLLVHRLDRDTSGVVILAKNEATQSMLRKQFQERCR